MTTLDALLRQLIRDELRAGLDARAQPAPRSLIDALRQAHGAIA